MNFLVLLPSIIRLPCTFYLPQTLDADRSNSLSYQEVTDGMRKVDRP